MHVAVVVPARCGQVADDRFVLHAAQGRQGHPHRVQHRGRAADLASVALGVPAQCSAGRVVRVVVERRGQGVVEPVEVVVRHADTPLGRAAAGAEERGGEEVQKYARQRSFHGRRGMTAADRRGGVFGKKETDARRVSALPM